MKKFTKIFLIISLVCIRIAAVCLGVGVALGSGLKEVIQMANDGEFNVANWNIGTQGIYFNMGEDEVKVSDVEKGSISQRFLAEEVERLDIDIKYGEVYFIDSDSDEIKIDIDAPKRNVYKCENEHGTLSLKDKTSSYKLNMGISINNDVTITIAIPKGKEFEEVQLVTNAGTMDITHEFAAKKVELELDAGEMEIVGLTAEELEIDCGVGEINLSGTVSKKVEADCGVGEITMRLIGSEEDYDYEIDCGVGSVNINGTSYSSLSTDKTINNHAGNKISLDCGVGEIDLTVEEE